MSTNSEKTCYKCQQTWARSSKTGQSRWHEIEARYKRHMSFNEEPGVNKGFSGRFVLASFSPDMRQNWRRSDRPYIGGYYKGRKNVAKTDISEGEDMSEEMKEAHEKEAESRTVDDEEMMGAEP
ncbi:hypothetical protein DL767_001265 [Monosporascus sp. MG133]|nr:hypothetical protein DL767_001265 [Monosporascus sp. MG133]